ncbi:MAG TPA: transcriptional regulator [Egibacteraceae bacterium]|nr:transcriptional regulator [Egibacteraceae bacterium]
MSAEGRQAAERSLPELDPVIHAQARLRVMATLSTVPDGDRLAFPRLQELLDLTAGNLSTHLRKLEDAGYVRVDKEFRGRTPVTWVRLTAKGRAAFAAYLEDLRAFVGDDTG